MAKLKTPGFFEDWIDGCSLFSAPLDSLTSCHDPRFPRSFYQRCVIVFAELNLVQFGSIQQARTLNTALSKLALWTEGFADDELDRALGESPQLKNAILELLSSLAVNLIKVSSIYLSSKSFCGENNAFTYHLKELEAANGQAQEILQSLLDDDLDSSDADSSSESGDEENNIANHTSKEMKDISISSSIVEEIALYISCLMNLLPTIESVLEISPSPKEPLANTQPLQVSSLAFPYVHQIGDKFKECDQSLAERLGEANWQRHKILRLHMDKEDTEEHEENTSKSTFIPVSLFRDSGYATTTATTSSFLTTQTESNSGSLRVPETPQEVAAEKPFSCFICNHELRNIRNRSEWKIHVFADIRPYVCTFIECKNALQMYPTRNQWADHEFSVHLKDSDKLRSCPFCTSLLSFGQKSYVSHISRHMESIALVSLPRDTESEYESNSSKSELLSSNNAAPRLEVDSQPQRDTKPAPVYKGKGKEKVEEEGDASSRLRSSKNNPPQITSSTSEVASKEKPPTADNAVETAEEFLASFARSNLTEENEKTAGKTGRGPRTSSPPNFNPPSFRHASSKHASSKHGSSKHSSSSKHHGYKERGEPTYEQYWYCCQCANPTAMSQLTDFCTELECRSQRCYNCTWETHKIRAER